MVRVETRWGNIGFGSVSLTRILIEAFMNPGNWIKKQSKFTIFTLALALFLLDEYLDYITGPDLNLSFFHIVPIFLIVWNSGLFAGVVYSVFCTFVIEGVSAYPEGHGFTNIEYFNAFANLVFFVAFSYVLNRLNKNLDMVTQMAERDGLTNLLNFNSFYQRADQEMKTAERQGQPLTVVYFDVDNFKQINDSFGHGEGDEVLKLIGSTLNDKLRKNDLRARTGGDEFALLLPELSFEQAKTTIPEIFGMLSRVMRENNKNVTFSVGAVTYLMSPNSVKEAIGAADKLMYQAKMNGKNNFILKLSTEL